MSTIKCLFWNANDSVVQVMISITSVVTLWYRPCYKNMLHAFLISNKQLLLPKPGWNWQKIRQMLSKTLRLNFCYFKIIHVLYPRYHLKLKETYTKNKRNDKCVCIHEIIRLIKMKIKTKMKKDRINAT